MATVGLFGKDHLQRSQERHHAFLHEEKLIFLKMDEKSSKVSLFYGYLVRMSLYFYHCTCIGISCFAFGFLKQSKLKSRFVASEMYYYRKCVWQNA